ncbi:hypothetical protein TNCT_205221 [Trichonephila clavata]|uniref:Uncharacterized protein n=1 Tax=Trichonephila clavata TaxID=2740835 RepID=A0A8X6LI08_TRICU|nr:hypothetical protein TNCT_205221 [Trichonephila clavata]
MNCKGSAPEVQEVSNDIELSSPKSPIFESMYHGNVVRIKNHHFLCKIKCLEGLMIENLFSNIGGLMGCWLGFSVWAFVNIIEKANLMFTNCMKKFKMKEKKRTDDTLFFPTHLKLHHK